MSCGLAWDPCAFGVPSRQLAGQGVGSLPCVAGSHGGQDPWQALTWTLWGWLHEVWSWQLVWKQGRGTGKGRLSQ